MVFLFGLAPGGVYPATTVASSAVCSYHTISPLPAWPAVYFLLHWPWAHAPQTLSGTLPCGARTFLQLVTRASDYPADLVTILPRLQESATRIALVYQLRPHCATPSHCGNTSRQETIGFRRIPGLPPAAEHGSGEIPCADIAECISYQF